MTPEEPLPIEAGAPYPAAAIARLIRERGPVPFDTFMELALYGSPGAYYERGAAAIGRYGDFYTAPDATPAFGWMIAEQAAECLGRLEESAVDLVELGAGKGLMAADLLDRLAQDHGAIYQRLTYRIVERSSAMREIQEGVLHAHAARVRWALDPSEVREGGIVGCVLANEFYDALPVRVVIRRGAELLERHVGLASMREGTEFGTAGGAKEENGFVWVDLPASDPSLIEYVRRYGAAPEDGSIAEAGLSAYDYASRVSRSVRRGFQIVIDYGDRAEKLYDVRVRPAGTLLAYHRHTTSDDVLSRVGAQDLTAHVNFSALEEAGRKDGMETAGFTTQDRFLIALGLADQIAQLAGSSDPASIQSRRAMMSLIHPEGMGGAFRVLVQSKGVQGASLKGLRDPWR